MSEREEPRAGYDSTSLAEEIRLLVEMVVERAAPWLDGVISGHGSEQVAGAADGPSGAGGWCPLCAIAAMVRGDRPEFAARVLEQAGQLIALLRAVLADRWEPHEGVHMPGFQPAARPSSRQEESSSAQPAPSGRVQHVAVRKRAERQPDQES